MAPSCRTPCRVPALGVPGGRQRAVAPSVVPEVLEGWVRPFRCHFTAAGWRHVLVLVAGTLLAPGRRTVAAALRVMGLGEAAGFAVYHRVLSHGHWCSRAVAHRLLLPPPAAPRRRFRAGRPGGGRPRRHHRAALGRPDRGAGDLP